MGQRRLAKPAADDINRRPQQNNNQRKQQNNTVLSKTSTRRGEVHRASRRTSENVNLRASQHMIDIPVNKSVYNGYDGRQFSVADQKKMKSAPGRPVLRVMPIGGLGEMGIG